MDTCFCAFVLEILRRGGALMLIQYFRIPRDDLSDIFAQNCAPTFPDFLSFAFCYEEPSFGTIKLPKN